MQAMAPQADLTASSAISIKKVSVLDERIGDYALIRLAALPESRCIYFVSTNPY